MIADIGLYYPLVVACCLAAGFMLLNIICAAIFDRIESRATWTRYIDDAQNDRAQTEDTGPK